MFTIYEKHSFHTYLLFLSFNFYLHCVLASQSIMRVQCYLTEHDKKMKRLQKSVEHNKNQADELKKSLDELKAARQRLEVQISNLNDLIKGLQDAVERTRAEGKAEERKEMEEELAAKLEERYN